VSERLWVGRLEHEKSATFRGHALAKGPGIDYKRRFRLQSDFGVRRLIKECEETEHGCAEEKDVAV
jgi:hypothetical protein